MFIKRLLKPILIAFIPLTGWSQVLSPNANTLYYLIHSSGNVVCENTDGRAIIKEVTGGDEQLLQFLPDGNGYYWVKQAGQNKYMALNGSWNTYFIMDSTTDVSRYSIEKVSVSFIRLKCKSNGKYLGTDNTTTGSNIYSDKDGNDSKHYWYISEHVGEIPLDTMKYLINPNTVFTNEFEGWGVSLCWWANMCGKWNDDKIDQIVDWMINSDGLNYNIFRYNIGGGDDPLNRNCTLHHMASGKGLRAEMEGFKDSLNGDYIWSRDAAQRKIMLKIKEKKPDAIFEAFSNSPPYYMTYSGCCSGNTDPSQDNLKPEYYEEFAHYLVDVCKFYKDSFNIEFKTLEPFNEPVTNYWQANGGQEGCHFNTSSQIAFLKILEPIIKASGLKTVISASDETNAAQSVTDFKAYITDGAALDLTGQWNTHTYSVTNQSRANLRALATSSDKTLWMSEVGSGGTGISGNLNLAQKLMDDIRYMRPEAWIDWQYIEEGNDQWCLVKGDFAAQTYQKIKNYYIRMQITRYIHPGSSFLLVPNDKMLAALNPSSDSLIIVILNNSSMKSYHQIDLSMFEKISSDIIATRTSETENNLAITDFSLQNFTLTLSPPAYSVTTLIVPVEAGKFVSDEIKTDVPYLLINRTASLIMQSDNTSVIISNFIYGDLSQVWKLKTSGIGYTITNLAGKILTDNGSYYSLALDDSLPGQVFTMESVGDGCYKVLSSTTGKSLDLEGEKNISGTKIGFWDYGTSPAASHRQWIFYELTPAYIIPYNPIPVELSEKYLESAYIYGTKGAILLFQKPGSETQIKIYTLTGKLIHQQAWSSPYSYIPMKPGIYIVSHNTKTNTNNSTKVVVR